MNDERTIFRYAPDIYNENQTMLQIYERQHEEIDEFEVLIVQVFLNNFIKTCNVEGIRRFEKIFHIQADEINESLEYRKSRIINKFTSQLPYTKIFLEQMLEGIFGEDKYEIDVLHDQYKIRIDLETTIEGLFEQTFKDLREIIPANMVIEQILVIPYMHKYLKKYFTHGQLTQFTYGELSQYAET